MNKKDTLFKQVVHITQDYLGPAADRFVTRQLESHLHKDPRKLEPGDLVNVIEWLRLSLAFITDDKDILHEYTSRLKALRKKKNGSKPHAKQEY